MSNRDHALTWLFSKNGPAFTQAKVLELAPNLSAVTLQNWANRNIVNALMHQGEEEVRGRRLYKGDQVSNIVLGSRLVDQFGLSPAEAIMKVIMATAEVFMEWTSDAVKGADHDDQKMPIKADWVARYWAISPGVAAAKTRAVLAKDIEKTLKELGRPCLVWPHGADLLDLARRAKAIYEDAA